MNRNFSHYDFSFDDRNFEYAHNKKETNQPDNGDDEDLTDTYETSLHIHEETYGFKSKCFRCGSKSVVGGKTPYCMNCNWDSLTA